MQFGLADHLVAPGETVDVTISLTETAPDTVLSTEGLFAFGYTVGFEAAGGATDIADVMATSDILLNPVFEDTLMQTELIISYFVPIFGDSRWKSSTRLTWSLSSNGQIYDEIRRPESIYVSTPTGGRELQSAGQFVRRHRNGPAIYIVLCGLLAGFASSLYLMRFDLAGFSFVSAGCTVGAIVYRVRSRNWPIDPTVFRRQFIYSLAAVTVPQIIFFVIVSIRAQGAGMAVTAGISVGLPVAISIFLSGNRRDGHYDPNANPKL